MIEMFPREDSDPNSSSVSLPKMYCKRYLNGDPSCCLIKHLVQVKSLGKPKTEPVQTDYGWRSRVAEVTHSSDDNVSNIEYVMEVETPADPKCGIFGQHMLSERVWEARKQAILAQYGVKSLTPLGDSSVKISA